MAAGHLRARGRTDSLARAAPARRQPVGHQRPLPGHRGAGADLTDPGGLANRRGLAAVEDSEWPDAHTGHLPRAGSLLAAAWFSLRGCDVAWPLEPCRYDLLVTRPGTTTSRIQVKTIQVQVGQTWKVYLSNTRRARIVYDSGEIDFFFVIDGGLECYLIPLDAVAGLHAIHLASYAAYRVERLGPIRT